MTTAQVIANSHDNDAVAMLKLKLISHDEWLTRAIIALDGIHQDDQYLDSFCRQLKAGKTLTARQLTVARNHIIKYAFYLLPTLRRNA